MSEKFLERRVWEELLAWKEKKNRKPLILRGARQTGKTSLLKHFGEKEYESMVYINLEDVRGVEELFEEDLNARRIVAALERRMQKRIIPGKTLLVLDEVQSVPRALSSLKYFCEEAPEYHVAVAGSLLGIALHEGTSFPVGKVDFLDLCPMNFEEFVRAKGRGDLAELVAEPVYKKELRIFHQDLMDLLKEYMMVGGMPEAVKGFVEDGDFGRVQEVHKAIIDAYELDFSKHAPGAETPKIRSIYNAIPLCLAKENKKFLFSAIRESARAREYEAALLWVEDTNLASRLPRVSAVKLPLNAYRTQNIFKLFLSDIGLLATRMFVSAEAFLSGEKLFTEFRGALAEQFVFQELRAQGENPVYYSNEDSRGEIDFMLDLGTEILPIEVKAGKNLNSISFDNFRKKWEIKKGVKLSVLPINLNEEVDNLPLYLAGTLRKHYTGEKQEVVI